MIPSIDRTYYTNFWPLLIWTLLLILTFHLIVQGFHRTYATGAACQQRTLTPPDTGSCPIWDLQMFFCWDHWHSSIHYTTNSPPFPWFDFLLNLTLLNIGFHGASATGVACWHGTLTPPDTLSCPTLGLACVLMSRPISPELVLYPDFWISNIPRYFPFASKKASKQTTLCVSKVVLQENCNRTYAFYHCIKKIVCLSVCLSMCR